MGVLTSVRRTALALLVTLALTASAGCMTRDNGLPRDLGEVLAGNNITVRFDGSEAPLSSRAGMVFIDADEGTSQEIVQAFGLKSVDPLTGPYALIKKSVAEPITGMWGVNGGPPSLKLKDGGQLEYLFAVTTESGRLYLFSAYAYG